MAGTGAQGVGFRRWMVRGPCGVHVGSVPSPVHPPPSTLRPPPYTLMDLMPAQPIPDRDGGSRSVAKACGRKGAWGWVGSAGRGWLAVHVGSQIW